MKIKISKTVTKLGITQNVSRVILVKPFGVPNGIPEADFTAKGDLLAGTGAGAHQALAIGNEGDVLTAAAAEASGMKWAPAASSGSGGVVQLTNQSGSDQLAGTIVIFDGTHDSSFTVSVILGDRRVAGVLTEDIAAGATGGVAVGGSLQSVKVTGNVARGQWMVNSTVSGRASQAGYFKVPGTIGIAVTAYGGGGNGTLQALILVDHYQALSSGKGYVLGGANASAAVTTTQVLTFASETCAIVAGAALTVAREKLASASGSDRGFSYSGTDGANNKTTADRTLFASDVTAAIAGAAIGTGESGVGCTMGSLAAYVVGGMTTTIPVATAWKMPWATETTAAQASANLSAARGEPGQPGASSTIGYFGGGASAAGTATAVSDKMPFSTETTAAVAGANLSSARGGAAGMFSSTNAYWGGGSTNAAVSTTTDKMPYSTETTAAVGGAALSAGRKFGAGLSGGANGYVLGGSTAVALECASNVQVTVSVATADKMPFSTDITVAAAGANLVTSMAAAGSLQTQVY